MAEEKIQGLILIGPIVHKEHIPAQGQAKDKFQLHVLVPGQTQLFIVTVAAEDFMKKNIGDEFKSRVRYNIFRDKAYWIPA